jgi:hypothetical protein
MAGEVLAVLGKHMRIGELENELVGLLGYLRFDFIKVCFLLPCSFLSFFSFFLSFSFFFFLVFLFLFIFVSFFV